MKLRACFLLFFLCSVYSHLFAGNLQFEETLLEVVAKPDQEQVTVVFNFKVTGVGGAIIQRVDAPCSCLEAQLSDGGRLSWKEKEEGTVTGIFKIGKFRGTVNKHITLFMEDGKYHDLTVRMTTPELVKIEPKTLKWVKGERPEPKVFEITVNHSEPIHLTEVSGTNEAKFPLQFETLEEGLRYQIIVTPSDLDDRGYGLIRIKTDSSFKKHQNYQAYVVVTNSFPKK